MIAWSRVQVGDHTLAQVLAGVALGVVVNAIVFRCCGSGSPRVSCRRRVGVFLEARPGGERDWA